MNKGNEDGPSERKCNGPETLSIYSRHEKSPSQLYRDSILHHKMSGDEEFGDAILVRGREAGGLWAGCKWGLHSQRTSWQQLKLYDACNISF